MTQGQLPPQCVGNKTVMAGLGEAGQTMAQRAAADEVPLGRGLSTRLLFLTILFVMLAEVLIFLPSVANFRIQ